MPDIKAAPQAEGHEVIFREKWVDTTRHGYMKDHLPSDKPVWLPTLAACAAVASGKAVPCDPEADGADDAGDAAE